MKGVLYVQYIDFKYTLIKLSTKTKSLIRLLNKIIKPNGNGLNKTNGTYYFILKLHFEVEIIRNVDLALLFRVWS